MCRFSQALSFIFPALTCFVPLSSAAPDCTGLQLTVNTNATTIQLPQLVDFSNQQAVLTAVQQIPAILKDGRRVSLERNNTIAAVYCRSFDSLTQTSTETTVVQLLVHGNSYSKEYWDNGAWNETTGTYSYQDYATRSGYDTLAIDLLGAGHSDWPDPLQGVQLPLHVEIIHKIALQIRSGAITQAANRSPKQISRRVVLVGHSLGSIINHNLLALYPSDIDAVVHTGFSSTTTDDYSNPEFATTNILSASAAFPQRFPDHPAAYLAMTNESARTALYYADGFSATLAHSDFLTESPFAFANWLTYPRGPSDAVPEYTGPVFVMNGESDAVSCGGDASMSPEDKKKKKGPCAEILRKTGELYPKASNYDWATVERAGHVVNFHYYADQAYKSVHVWLNRVLYPLPADTS